MNTDHDKSKRKISTISGGGETPPGNLSEF